MTKITNDDNHIPFGSLFCCSVGWDFPTIWECA